MSTNPPDSLSRSPAPAEAGRLTAGWGRALRGSGCAACGAAHLHPAELTLEACTACASVELSDQPVRARPEAPELVVPFAVDSAQLAARLARWRRRSPYPPDDLTPDGLVRRARRVYLPVWLVDATVRGTWEAEAGFDYRVASTREEYRQGSWATRRIEETRIRWEPRAGTLERRYDNRSVPALEEHRTITRWLGRFDSSDPRPWSHELLADAAVRVPDRSPTDVWPNVISQLDRAAEEDVRRACGAAHLREMVLDAQHDDPTWTLLLLPVYATSYRKDDGERLPVLIHGQSGRVAGRLQASTRKAWRRSGWLGAIGGLLVALGLLLRGLMPAAVIAVICGMLLCAVAPAPIVRAWRFNARNDARSEAG